MTVGTASYAHPKRFDERVDAISGERYLAVFERGPRLKDDPFLNKGTCFTAEERAQLGLSGLLPPAIVSPKEQEARALFRYGRLDDDMQRYRFLAALQDRNETLFHRLLLHHLDEMAPIVHTPTVERFCDEYNHVYRRARGLYLSAADRGRIAQVLLNAPADDVRIVVVTDNEAVHTVGDQGIGGMGVAVGKLVLYTAGAGIHPALGLPIDFDVGTDNRALLEDPLYLGARHPRLRGADYISLLDELVEAIAEVWPRAIVQWEGFSSRVASEVLERYRGQIPSFNDAIQGTGATVLAGVRAALVQVGRRLQDERFIVFGCGLVGSGVAFALRRALHEIGLSHAEVGSRVLCFDSKGLILANRPRLVEPKAELAADPDIAAAWKHRADGHVGLMDAVRGFSPTVLIGASGQPGAFGERIIRALHRGVARPIILPLSHPPRCAEAKPADLLWWTSGEAVIGSGNPSPPLVWRDRTIEIGHAAGALIFPGVALGAMVAGARWIPDRAFRAASRVLFEETASSQQAGGAIFPPLTNLRAVSRRIATVVARSIAEAGAAAPLDAQTIEARIATTVWEPNYLPYRPA